MFRKISIIAIAILLMGGIAFAQPGYRQNPGEGDILGQGNYQSDPHKIFRMVRYVPPTFSGSTALGADSIVSWDLTDDDGVTVTTTTTSWDTTVAGIIVVQALTQETDGNTAVEDRGRQNWTWLQTYGLSEVFISTTVDLTAGDAFGTSSTAGEATMYEPSTQSPYMTIDARQQGMAGFVYDDATAGDDDVECFLRLD